MLERFYQNKQTILKKTQDFFLNSNFPQPKVGMELEFFLLQKNLFPIGSQGLIEDLVLELKKELIKNFSLVCQAEREQGDSQIEIKTNFTPDFTELCCQLCGVKNFVKNFAENKNLIASFAAQPFSEDCGSALQFNLSLHDKNDQNLFEKDGNFLVRIANCLLSATNLMMIFLAPQSEDYHRFSFQLNRDLFKRGKFTAPVNLSFGADNRTCAIRIPQITKQKPGKRIEYRVAAAGADPFLSLAAILLSISYEAKGEKTGAYPEFTQIFGNAFDQQYSLKDFCKSLKEAEEKFLSGENFIRKGMERLINDSIFLCSHP